MFNQIYEQKCKELRLVEGTRNGRIFLGRRRRFFGIEFGNPVVVGEVLEKPQPDGTGIFRVQTGLKSPVWDLAGAIEESLGRESEVQIGPAYLTHRLPNQA